MCKDIHIALNIDSHYVMQCCTTMVSVIENNKDSSIVFHVITSGLRADAQAQIEQLVAGYGQEVHFYLIDEARLAHYLLFDQKGHISMATYFRLFVADLLPEELERVLYLDCDLIVNGSITELWNTDLGDKAVGAVEDMWSGLASNYERLKYDRADTYFNAGVLLINLVVWRNFRLSHVASDYVVAHEGQLRFNDQDVLNALFHDRKRLLPFFWNVQDGLLRRRRKIRKEAITALNADLRHPVIIHFTGSRKPWNYDCLNPYRSLFFKYLDMTPWKGWRPVIPLSWRVKRVIDKVLYALRLKPRKYIDV